MAIDLSRVTGARPRAHKPGGMSRQTRGPVIKILRRAFSESKTFGRWPGTRFARTLSMIREKTFSSPTARANASGILDGDDGNFCCSAGEVSAAASLLQCGRQRSSPKYCLTCTAKRSLTLSAKAPTRKNALAELEMLAGLEIVGDRATHTINRGQWIVRITKRPIDLILEPLADLAENSKRRMRLW